MKRILFIDGSLSCGGAEVLLVNYANLLSKYYDVTILTSENYHNELSSKLNANIKCVSIINTSNYFIFRILQFIMMKILSYGILIRYLYYVKKIKLDEFDYVVPFLEGFSTNLVKKVNAIKYAWVHTDLIDNNWCYKKDKINEVYKNFNKIIFVSKGILKKYQLMYPTDNRFIAVHNMLDIDLIKQLSAESTINEYNSLFTIISVGRLEKVKGYERLLEVAIRLNKEGFLFKIIIIGNGSQYNYLKNMIVENQMEKVICLYGFQENPYKFINKADLFILPSFAEGLPNVLYEALILEKPVIATKNAGSLEVLNNGEYGMIVENSFNGIYSGLKMVLQSSDEYLKLALKAKKASQIVIEENNKIHKWLLNLFQ